MCVRGTHTGIILYYLFTVSYTHLDVYKRQSQDGILIRMHANDINVQSRYGSGVRVMRLIGEDKVAVLARVDRDATAETAKPEDDGETDPTPEELEAIAAAEAAEEAAEDAAPDIEGEDEE